jgi:hypothetical protein
MTDLEYQQIYDAASYIGNYCAKWGRLGGQYKEKYGTVRFYAMFGAFYLHSLIYPGYYYNQFPRWLWVMDIYYIGPFIERVFGAILYKWQSIIYRRAYKNALAKWPHLREPILKCSDLPDLLQGL